MNSVENYQPIIRRILTQYTRIPYAHGQLECKAVLDPETDSYLLVTLSWDGSRRIHAVLVHIDIINGKVWIQRDGTKDGIVDELEQAGIPRSHIVLGFHPPEVRAHTEYTVT